MENVSVHASEILVCLKENIENIASFESLYVQYFLVSDPHAKSEAFMRIAHVFRDEVVQTSRVGKMIAVLQVRSFCLCKKTRISMH